MSSGIVFDIKEFTLHDGPGVRTTIFFKGCPLRCLWCHNPEGISPTPQLLVTRNGCSDCGLCKAPCDHADCKSFGRCVHICPSGLLRLAGMWYEAKDLAQSLLAQAPLLTDGGITFSGGEPLMQPEFLFELISLLRPMHTLVETSGFAPHDVFKQAVALCDIVYMDIKHTDRQKHKMLTGVDPAPILRNLAWLTAQPKPFVIRVPLIPEINDDQENLVATARLLKGAHALRCVEFLPYNPFTPAKYTMVGMACMLSQTGVREWVPNIPADEFERCGIPFRLL